MLPEKIPKFKVLVVGCGSIGIRHIQNLRILKQDQILVCSAAERVAQAIQKYGVYGFTRLKDALHERPDVVLVCNETNLHVPTARAALQSGAHVFIEKPLSHSLTGVHELLLEARSLERCIAVGYCLRFHPVIKMVHDLLQQNIIGRCLSVRVEMGQYLPLWRPSRNYWETYTACRERGGGIILDMSHEIDYMIWLFGCVKELMCYADKLSSLRVDAEDVAVCIMRFASGLLGELHLDFVQRHYSRGGKVIGDQGMIYWNLPNAFVRYLVGDCAEWQEISFSGYDSNQMYLDEIKHFLTSALSGTRSMIDIEEGIRTLTLSLAIRRSAMHSEREVVKYEI